MRGLFAVAVTRVSCASMILRLLRVEICVPCVQGRLTWDVCRVPIDEIRV